MKADRRHVNDLLQEYDRFTECKCLTCATAYVNVFVLATVGSEYVQCYDIEHDIYRPHVCKKGTPIERPAESYGTTTKMVGTVTANAFEDRVIVYWDSYGNTLRQTTKASGNSSIEIVAYGLGGPNKNIPAESIQEAPKPAPVLMRTTSTHTHVPRALSLLSEMCAQGLVCLEDKKWQRVTDLLAEALGDPTDTREKVFTYQCKELADGTWEARIENADKWCAGVVTHATREGVERAAQRVGKVL